MRLLFIDVSANISCHALQATDGNLAAIGFKNQNCAVDPSLFIPL